MNPKEIEAVMLIGKSRRMKDKPFIEVRGKKLFRYGYETLERVFRDVLIVCEVGLAARLKGYNTVAEDYGIGPLGAIYEGARNTTSSYIFVAGCDMPFLDDKVLRFLCDNVGVDGAVPVHGDGKLEPLHSVYRRERILELDVPDKGGRISDIIRKMDVNLISVDEIREYDPRLLTFRNINTEEDINSMLGFNSLYL